MNLRYMPPPSHDDRPPLTIGHASLEGMRDDVMSRLLDRRLLFLGPSLDDDKAVLVAAQLMHLQSVGPREDITLCINAAGGSPTALLTVFDSMESVATDVATICIGQASGPAALLLAAGAKGKRFALPNARVVIAHAREELAGAPTDVDLHAREIIRGRRLIEELLAAHTGATRDEVAEEMRRGRILTAEEARQYGIIDRVVADEIGLAQSLPRGEGTESQDVDGIRNLLRLLS